MTVTSYAVARPAYYDRNATSYIGAYVVGGVAPHAATTRTTTTVAAGKKLLVESLTMYVNRDSVAAPVGTVFILPQVQASPSNLYLTRLLHTSNVANSTTSAAATTQFTIYAGETFFVDSLDTSTGGSITYVVGAKGTTFDA